MAETHLKRDPDAPDDGRLVLAVCGRRVPADRIRSSKLKGASCIVCTDVRARCWPTDGYDDDWFPAGRLNAL